MKQIKASAYFNENIKPKIIELLNTAKQEVFVASAWFNDKDLYGALLSLPRNVKTNVLIKKDEGTNSLDWKKLGDNNISVYQLSEEEGTRSLMHHKFCLIDNHTVITGSYNWTNGAKSHNYENIVVIDGDKNLYFQFKQQFEKIIQPIIAWLEEEKRLLSDTANEHIEKVKANTDAHIQKVRDAEEEIIDYMDKYKEKPLGKLKFTQETKATTNSSFGNGVVVRTDVINTSSIKQFISELVYKTVLEREMWWIGLSRDLKYFFNKSILYKGNENYEYPGDIAIQNILLLKELNCSFCNISDVSNIQGLKHLKTLKIDSNNLQSLNYIYELDNLEKLICNGNDINDKLNGLHLLKKLKELHCYNNKLGTLVGIEHLPDLKIIKCSLKFKKMPLELLRLQNSGFKNTSTSRDYATWTR